MSNVRTVIPPTAAAAESTSAATTIAKALGLDAKNISQIVDIPTIGDLYRDGKGAISTVHTDAVNSVSTLRGDVVETKDQAVETLQYAVLLTFILLGGSVLLYGDKVFSAFVAIYDRIKQNGVLVAFNL